MSLLIQDGRRGGHLRWALEAIKLDVAAGVVISPFHTPRVAVPRHCAGSKVAAEVTAAGAEAVFDPSTHARLLPNSDDLEHYETWQLWGPSGVGLDTDTRRLEHLERVFARQQELSVSALAPTLTLDGALGVSTTYVLRTAQLAHGMDRSCWLALSGRRSFWRSGADLDAYVGQLAALRAPCWVLTMVNDTVIDNAPDLEDTDAFVGLCRTAHSLSQRGRVIVCHADYGGLPAVAAGASEVGTGWDRGMRYFDPRSFQLTSNSPRIPASYVTQGGLGSVLRRDTADAIARLGEPQATVVRGGRMPLDDAGERVHHLRQLSDLAAAVDGHGRNRRARVQELRAFYEGAIKDFNGLMPQLPGRSLPESLRKRWLDNAYKVLKKYAEAEDLW